MFTTTTVNGRQAWQTSTQDTFLYFRIPSNFTNAGQPLYVAITYADSGYGLGTIQYDSTQGAYTSSEVHSRSSRVNGGGLATMYAQLQQPSLQHRENGAADFRFSSESPIEVVSVSMQTTPFTDPTFQTALTTPWLTPVLGRTQPAADATTLKGAVMVGYQGWFQCPNDLADQGWVHWASPDLYIPQNFATDMWPYMAAYPQSAQCRADALSLQSGQPAYVFSDANLPIVEQQFAWMQQYNIDGVFLQRNWGANSWQSPQSLQPWALANVRRAAADHGRTWAIEFAVSGLTDANVVQTVEADWKWLVSSAHILQDSGYSHEGGKPVVVLWGYSIDPTTLSPATGDTLVDFFKNDPVYGGNYVIGGISNAWPNRIAAWQEHFSHYNGMLVWQTHNFAQDIAEFGPTGLNEDYYADVYPNIGYNDRLGGQYYWNELYGAAAAGSKRMFVGMFDEYDEATAIMPMSDDTPATLAGGRQFLNNEGQSPLWWLQLTADGKAMMNGQTPVTATMP